jgi:hypothetical protein
MTNAPFSSPPSPLEEIADLLALGILRGRQRLFSGLPVPSKHEWDTLKTENKYD